MNFQLFHFQFLIQLAINKIKIIKKVSKLIIFNLNFKNINTNKLKLTLTFYFLFMIYQDVKIFESSNVNVIYIFKNLYFISFLIFINSNDINKFQITIKKYKNILNILNKHIKNLCQEISLKLIKFTFLHV